MQFISESPLAWITFQAKLIKDSASAVVQRRTQAIINRTGDTVAWLEDGVGGQRRGTRGMWRMKRALASQNPLCRATEERSLVFHRALMCRAGSLGCCRIPELGFALQSLFMLFWCVRSQEQTPSLSSLSLQPTGTDRMGLKADSRCHWQVYRLPGSQDVPLLFFSQGALLTHQASGTSLWNG